MTYEQARKAMAQVRRHLRADETEAAAKLYQSLKGSISHHDVATYFSRQELQRLRQAQLDAAKPGPSSLRRLFR